METKTNHGLFLFDFIFLVYIRRNKSFSIPKKNICMFMFLFHRCQASLNLWFESDGVPWEDYPSLLPAGWGPVLRKPFGNCKYQ